MITINYLEIFILFLSWIISIIVTWKITTLRYKNRLDDLKDMSLRLKITLENAIKDKMIDKQESIEIRDAVVDLEQEIGS